MKAAPSAVAGSGISAVPPPPFFDDGVGHGGPAPLAARHSSGGNGSSAAPGVAAPAPAGPAVDATAPLISVVTPSYNQGRFLERCLRSVFEQGYPAFEHLVQDNCSTDETPAVLRRYPHVRSVSEPDAGQSDALNRALGRARGEIIAWLNADDFYEPGALAAAAGALRRGTGVQVIAGAVRILDPDGNVRAVARPRPVTLPELVAFWRGGCALWQPGVLFRREVMERVGPLRTDLNYVMDYELWLRVARHYPIRVIDRVLANHVIHPASKSGGARFGGGFVEELARVSRAYWGRPWTPRYWRHAIGCRRYLAEQQVNALVAAHVEDNRVDWAALGRLLRRWPPYLFHRHVVAVALERTLG